MPGNPHLLLQGTVIAVYLALMMSVGWVFKRFNRNTSDYFRGGCRATWWLVGFSSFMSGFSAWTFTGAAGAAYLHGWSVLMLNLGSACGFFFNFIFFGAWARQMRGITAPGIIQQRFDESTRILYAILGMVVGTLVSGIQLYGLAIFSASVFGFPTAGVIVTLGFVVIFYSAAGGSWAVMMADFLQGLILVPITLLLAILCLTKLGGPVAFFQTIASHGLAREFALIKAPGSSPGGEFTLGWAFAMLSQKILDYNTLNGAGRYFSVKDGASARKAALLSCVLFLFGSAFWFIPPITARLVFSDSVSRLALAKPEEAAYAVACLQLLPAGLVAVMVVAIFSATMSAMDHGLNRNAGIVVCDLYPLFCRLTGRRPADPGHLLGLSRIVTVFLGMAIASLAFYFGRHRGNDLFGLMIGVSAMLSVPLTVPLLWCMFLRRTPPWAAFVAVVSGSIVSLLGYFSDTLFGHNWNLQTRFFANLAGGSLGYLATLPFWRWTSSDYRHKVDEFFTRMHTPVNFTEEVGEPNDALQMRFAGMFCLIIGGLILGLTLLPGTAADRTASGSVGSVVAGMGVLLRRRGQI